MPTNVELRNTPLIQAHIDSGARLVEYAGWSMPVLYTSILEEARAVRTGVGIFDISHMGRTRISGANATGLLQKLTTNDIDSLAHYEAQYSLLSNPTGGIIDDIIVYRETADTYLIVINASNTEKDLRWIGSHVGAGVEIADNTSATAMIAVQGPGAPIMVSALAGNAALLSLQRFQFAQGAIGGAPATFCRTGYTGEDGFEVIVPAADAVAVWNGFRDANAVQCGLGARDALRIEAGYPLYGHEIDDSTNPVEAGLMWVVRLDKGDFTGSDRIRTIKSTGSIRKLVGLRSEERQQPRQGYIIYRDGNAVGTVTSGVFSPTRNRSIAMGYISAADARTGTEVEISIRDRRIGATVCAKKSLLDDLPQ